MVISIHLPPPVDRQYRCLGIGHPHIVLELSHVLFDRSFFRERPWQHELGLEHRSRPLDHAVEGCRHPAVDRMANAALHVGNGMARIALLPCPIEGLGDHAELDDEVSGKVLGLDLAALFPPEAQKGRLVRPHDDASVGSADEMAALETIGFGVQRSLHDLLHISQYAIYDYKRYIHGINRFSTELI
jgi:hypothetical protein